MKKIVLILLLLPLWYACTQESLMEEGEKAKTEKVVVRFKINQAPMNVVNVNGGVTTRAIQASDVVSDKVLDMWVVQFDDAGNFMQKSYFKNIDITAFDVPLTPHPAGTGGNVYFLANIGVQLDYPEKESTFMNQMKKFSNLDDQLITGDDGKKYVPMYDVQNVKVSPNGRISVYPNITLSRMVSQVNITYSIKDNTIAKFVPDSIRVCNVPEGINFSPKGREIGVPTTFYALKNYTLTNAPTSSDTFTFFVPENCQGYRSDKPNERGQEFVEKATHIEFKGHTLGSMGGQAVTFRYYLGYDNTSSYNSIRNTLYNIVLSIDGMSQGDQRFEIPERSNCYLVKPNATIEIPVMRANESDLGIQIPDVTTGWTASLYWCTINAALVTVTPYVSKGYFTVKAGANQGNAVVVVKNGDNVLWSWHIWVDDEDPTTNTALQYKTSDGTVWLDRNIGAIGTGQNGGAWTFADTGGFYYQWGRKDPFIGSNTVGSNVATFAMFAQTGNFTPTYPMSVNAVSGDSYTKSYTASNAESLQYSVRYPALFMLSWRGSSAGASTSTTAGHDSWGGEFDQAKSVYDPCPAGWRVPSGYATYNGGYSNPWQKFSSAAALGSSGDNKAYQDYSPAVNVSSGNSGVFRCQGMGYRNSSGALSNVGHATYYGTACQSDANNQRDLWNGTGYTSVDNKCVALPIRCVKEVKVVKRYI